MIGGLYRQRLSRIPNALARALLAARLLPNHVTCLGLALVLAASAFYAVSRSSLWFAAGLSIAFALDAVDGAMARSLARPTKFGGDLDAGVDRLQELAVYATLAWVNDWWPLCFFAVTGSLLVSYNKARAAVEMPIDNTAWPDLLERPERAAILCVALLANALGPDAIFGRTPLYIGLAIIAVLSYATAAQRFLRARNLLIQRDREDRP